MTKQRPLVETTAYFGPAGCKLRTGGVYRQRLGCTRRGRRKGSGPHAGPRWGGRNGLGVGESRPFRRCFRDTDVTTPGHRAAFPLRLEARTASCAAPRPTDGALPAPGSARARPRCGSDGSAVAACRSPTPRSPWRRRRRRRSGSGRAGAPSPACSSAARRRTDCSAARRPAGPSAPPPAPPRRDAAAPSLRRRGRGGEGRAEPRPFRLAAAAPPRAASRPLPPRGPALTCCGNGPAGRAEARPGGRRVSERTERGLRSRVRSSRGFLATRTACEHRSSVGV